MKIDTRIPISGMFLLAVVVSALVLYLGYAMQNPQVMANLASIGWNGYILL